MLEYFTIKKFRKHNHPPPSADGSLTPLLAPHDERFLAQVIEEPAGNTEPESVILNGPQPQQAPLVADTPVKTATDNVPKTAPPAVAGDKDWKGALREKWGYLEAVGSTTASRLGQAVVGKGKDKDKEKDKGKGKEKETEALADEVEVSAVIMKFIWSGC